jgi:hypothetical protein
MNRVIGVSEVMLQRVINACPCCGESRSGPGCPCDLDYLRCRAELEASHLRWRKRWTPTPEMRGEQVAA